MRIEEEKAERLWKRYWAIRDDHAPGHREPILWHLALRHDALAMATLADTFSTAGHSADPFSRVGLYRRAERRNYIFAAQHLAMDAFNVGDLKGYRHWLRRAARVDPDSKSQLKRFELRMPHSAARKIGRHRPYRRGE